jgi:diguanylate cyclase (GGDEF)-like protein/PAS domain S-box-containing protein
MPRDGTPDAAVPIVAPPAGELAALLDALPDAVIGVRPDGRVALVNQQAERIFGYRRAELIGRPIELLVPEEQRFAHQSQRSRFFANPNWRPMEARSDLRARRRDGSEFPADISVSTTEIDGRTLAIATVRDVTARLSHESALRHAASEQAELLDTVIENAPIGTALMFGDGSFARVNRALCQLLGHTEAELLEMTFREITHTDDLELTSELLAGVLERGLAGVDTEKRFLDRDGEVIWGHLSVAGVRDPDGELAYCIVQIEDRTEARTAAQAVSRLAAIVESSEDAIVAATLDGTVTDWNAAAARIYGYGTFEMLGRPVALLAPGPAQRQELGEILDDVSRGDAVEHFETQQLCRDGRVIDTSIRVSAIRDPDGEIVGVSMVARDISGTKRAARELAEAEGRFRSAFDHAPIGMGVIAADGSIERANEALGAICERPVAELCGMSFWGLLHTGDVAAARATLGGLLAGRASVTTIELRLTRPAGAPVEIALYCTAMSTAGGESPQILIQCQDVTARNRYEHQLKLLADRDPLTGLWNRRRFEQELEHHVAFVNRYGAHGAVLLLDVDRFKSVNDTLGHQAGDQLLLAVATALVARLRESDIVARLGGDEFVILLPRADEAEAGMVAGAINAAVRDGAHPAGWAGPPISVSIGVSMFTGRPATISAETVLAQADRAMYDAKQAGAARWVLFGEAAPSVASQSVPR